MTIFQQNGPNHLRLWYNAIPEHKMAQVRGSQAQPRLLQPAARRWVDGPPLSQWNELFSATTTPPPSPHSAHNTPPMARSTATHKHTRMGCSWPGWSNRCNSTALSPPGRARGSDQSDFIFVVRPFFGDVRQTLPPTVIKLGMLGSVRSPCRVPRTLKVRTPAHTKQLGWYLEFESRGYARQPAVGGLHSPHRRSLMALLPLPALCSIPRGAVPRPPPRHASPHTPIGALPLRGPHNTHTSPTQCRRSSSAFVMQWSARPS